MAAESNTGFHRKDYLGSALNRHAISLQSDAINSSSEMIAMGNYFGMNTSYSTVILPGNSSMINTTPPGIVHVQAVNSSASSHLLDSAPGLKHDTGLAVEWSLDEQCKLEEGLKKFADEPSILRYIKIAATLRDKTVRDVALRCRWMTRKRRKAEEYNVGKKVNNRKDKLVESSLKMNLPSAAPQNMAVYPLLMHRVQQGEPLSFEGISGTTRHLLEQNAQAFSKITANLSTFKDVDVILLLAHIRCQSDQVKELQDNIDLFCRTRTNITAILNDMRHMPGIMSQMPPLPVSINEDLANSILPSTTQSMLSHLEHSMMFGSPGGIQLKQEPRC